MTDNTHDDERSTRDVERAATRNATCPLCARSFEQVRLPHPGRDLWVPVECTACRLGSSGDILPVDAESARRALRLRMLEMPHGYEHCTLDNFETRGLALLQRKDELAHAYCAEWPLNAGRSVQPLVVLQGAHQTGKTHFAIGLAKQIALAYDARARYAVVADVVRELRAMWNGRVEREDRETSVIVRYRAYSLLVLDEVSRHALASMGDVSAHLYDIVGERVAQQRPTILITNDASGGDLEALIGPALTSRVGARSFWVFGDVPFAARAVG